MGHWIEWGRLMLHIHAALEARLRTTTSMAAGRCQRSCSTPLSATPWATGMARTWICLYSVDWERENRWCVNEYVGRVVEAMGTAYALYTVTGDSRVLQAWYLERGGITALRI